MRFTILGAPRTLGNHPTMVRRGKMMIRIAPPAYRRWKKLADSQFLLVKVAALRARIALPIRDRVQICALFYRDRESGDLDNYEKGLGDWLQHVGIIGNDRQIASWDGSRLLKDAARPRIEIEITPFEEARE